MSTLNCLATVIGWITISYVLFRAAIAMIRAIVESDRKR